MDFLSLAEKRVSTREFSDKKIEKEDLEKILKACDIAPTGKNRRPIFYVILSSEEKKRRFFSFFLPFRLSSTMQMHFCFPL